MSISHANPEVLEFYKSLPFNSHGSPSATASEIRKQAYLDSILEIYPPLRELLDTKKRILDLGCGVGWLSNMFAYYYKIEMVGVDFNPVAVEYSREVGNALGSSAYFVESDLFEFVPEDSFDLVISLGVLHHTNDCIQAIRHACRNLVKDEGYFFLGLYHTYGRKPFLEHFRQLRADGVSEETLLNEYRKLHSTLVDETHLYSWFRDQVLHPHETQHTLSEIVPVLQSEGLELVSTSVNDFSKLPSMAKLYKLEKKFEKLGRKKLKNHEYYAGFFSLLARKTG